MNINLIGQDIAEREHLEMKLGEIGDMLNNCTDDDERDSLLYERDQLLSEIERLS
ncbi:MAG: hypothetical protein ACRC1M_06035 [Methanobacteriaceae archaeon]